MVMVYVNILVGAAGFTIYALWAGKWLGRRRWALALLNLGTAFVIAAFAFGYASIALRPYGLYFFVGNGFFRYLAPFLVAFPVVARIAEYRNDQARENYSRTVVEKMMSGVDGPS